MNEWIKKRTPSMRSLFPSVLFDAKTLRPSRKRRKSAEERAYIKISGTRPSVRPSVRRGIASRGSTTPSETPTPIDFTFFARGKDDAERPMWFPPTLASDESSNESSDEDGNVKKKVPARSGRDSSIARDASIARARAPVGRGRGRGRSFNVRSDASRPASFRTADYILEVCLCIRLFCG